jgi:pimeloyl-ACP methyl ester carboxylesterase
MMFWVCLQVLVFFLVAAQSPLRAEQASQLKAWHRAGQTFLTWREGIIAVLKDNISVQELQNIQTRIEQATRVRFRIYRSNQPIRSVRGLKPIAEVPPLSGWNMDYYGIAPKPEYNALRYVVEEGKEPVAPGTGIYVHNPRETGKAYYAVTVLVNDKEDTALDTANALPTPVDENVGAGLPVLQRVVKPVSFQYIENPTLHYYVRWEAPPNSSVAGKPYDYVVAIPPTSAKPASVGLHLHAWGGSLNHDYGWWFNGEKGAILVASNQLPYDWWTGYHEGLGTSQPLKTGDDWVKGIVRPYSQRRMLSFLDWVATRWEVDLRRTFVAGNSMGGSGALMFALRYPERIAWAISWVGIHIPSMSPTFKSSYELVYGKPEWGVKFEDGTPVWDYFNDAWYLRRYPEQDLGFVTFSNGKNDAGIGWPQAVEYYRALQETRQPHMFVWGQEGHNQRASMPRDGGERVMPIDIRTNQSLPAFTNCSLDNNPGTGDPGNGDAAGQINGYLYWETDTIIDRPERWEITAGLIEGAPRDSATVDITPRRRQQFRARPGDHLTWTNTSLHSNKAIQSGQVVADQWGLITLEKVLVGKSKNRISITKANSPARYGD